MGSLSYVCWVYCLVQVAIVSARPEFGTSLTYALSSDINSAAVSIALNMGSLDDQLDFTLSGQITGSEAKLALLAPFAGQLLTKGQLVTDALQTAVSSSSDVPATFGSVLDAYDELMTFVNDNNEAFFSTMSEAYGSLLYQEMLDSLTFAFSRLAPSRDAFMSLQDALTDPNAEEELDDLFREFLLALASLNAHLQAMCYVFQRAGVNLRTADLYYVSYEAAVSDLYEPVEEEVSGMALGLFDTEVSSYNEVAYDFRDSVNDYFNQLVQEYDAMRDKLEMGLSGPVSSSPSFNDLVTALTVLVTTSPGLLEGLQDSAAMAVESYVTDLEGTVDEAYFQGPKVFYAADALVNGLIDSDVFAEYCFAKYQALVEDLPTLGLLHLNECLDTEHPRWRKFRHVVDSFVTLLSYDVEDLWLNLETCAKHRTRRDECFSDLTELYTALGADHQAKYSSLQQLIATELAASQTRLKICLAAANFYTLDNVVYELVENMTSCFEGHDCMAGMCESGESGESGEGMMPPVIEP